MRACAGDLAQPQLGLSQSVYDSLCSELDTIVHNGALVNHAYSYEQLFEPNVLGSVEVSESFSVTACPVLLHPGLLHPGLPKQKSVSVPVTL